MVAVSTLIVMVLNLILGILIPVVLYVIIRKKFRGSRIAFFTGCGIMFIFAFVLESIVHSIVLGGSLGNAITGNLLLYALYGGIMAGIFEETGRFVAFRFLLKKYEGQDGTALVYGAGHGGFEAFYLLFFSGINNLFLGIALNSGNGAALTAGLSGDALLQVEAAISQIQTISWFVFLLSPIERMAAVLLQLSLSVVVWYAVKEKRISFFGLAVFLHFLVDTVAVIVSGMLSSLGTSGMVLTEIVVWAMAFGIGALAVKVWKNRHKEIPKGIMEP